MSRSGSKYGGQGWGPQQTPWWRRIAHGDNPLTWSVPFGRVAGISLQISLIYVVWMVIELLTSKNGFSFTVSYVASLFVLVLLHEFGHCFACRAVGGEADNILMWMLGGLASCRSPHNWKANLVTTAGGPMVNVVLVPVFMGVLMGLGVPVKALLFNPFSGSGQATAWGMAIDAMHTHSVPDWLRTPLFTLHVTNLALLLFNVLLPMFPMDGGRLFQNILWKYIGYTKSMWTATTVGLVCACLVGLFGLTIQSPTLVGLAIMSGMTCFQQRRQLRFIGEGMMSDERWSQWGADGEGWKVGGKSVKTHTPSPSATRKQEKARKVAETEREKAIAETAELDRILAKIKDKGMASLSKSEEAFLRRSTQRSRGVGGGGGGGGG